MSKITADDSAQGMVYLIGPILIFAGILALVYAGDLEGKLAGLIVTFIGVLLTPGLGPVAGQATVRGLGLLFTGPGILIMIAFLVLVLVTLKLSGFW
jgi:hypothetical protein